MGRRTPVQPNNHAILHMKYDYRVCIAQQGRITFVNGKWHGTGAADDAESLGTCPEVHSYLAAAGESGWELVTVVGRCRARAEDEPTLDRLFFPVGEADRGWHTWDTLYLKQSRP